MVDSAPLYLRVFEPLRVVHPFHIGDIESERRSDMKNVRDYVSADGRIQVSPSGVNKEILDDGEPVSPGSRKRIFH